MPRMLAKLPESSRHRGAASRTGTVVSVVVHATLTTLAVVATSMGGVTPAPPKPIDHGVIWISSGEHPPREEGTSSDGGARRTERRATTPTTRGPSAPGPIDVVVDDPGQGLPPIGDGFGRAANGGDREDGPGSVGGDGVDAPFDANVVEVAARLRPGSPVPRYPDELRDARLEGRVLARFVVDTAGRVEPASVRIVSSTHPLFASAVRAILPTLRFTPARARGTKVRQLVELPFEFEVGR